MAKVYTFNIYIDKLKDKIYRKIEITSLRTLAELSYTILSSFKSLALHEYEITYGKKIYRTQEDAEIEDMDEVHGFETYLMKDITLENIGFTNNKKMKMTYDFGTPTVFIIEFLEERELENGNGRHYPYVISGNGRGMIEDVSSDELEDIVKFTDKNGYSNYELTGEYNIDSFYDYRVYDIKCDNNLLKGEIEDIRDIYE